jgi:hypothetical protein
MTTRVCTYKASSAYSVTLFATSHCLLRLTKGLSGTRRGSGTVSRSPSGLGDDERGFEIPVPSFLTCRGSVFRISGSCGFGWLSRSWGTSLALRQSEFISTSPGREIIRTMGGAPTSTSHCWKNARFMIDAQGCVTESTGSLKRGEAGVTLPTVWLSALSEQCILGKWT